MEKAPDAFRTISEVAEDLDLPQHVLRFWETRFGQIKPMKRGGGRRYYRPDDVDLLRGIRHLLYGEGYTIRGVQRILKDEGIKFVQSVWKAGAPQPERAPVDPPEGGEQPPLARPLPGRASRGASEIERGRGLFGLLPSLLGSSHDDLGGADSGERTEPRIEPSIEEIFAELSPRSPAEPAADEDDDSSATLLPPIAAARAPMAESSLIANGGQGGEGPAKIPVDDLRKLRATLGELGECRSLLDAALTE